MNANKILKSVILAALIVASPTARADEAEASAPALFAMREIVLQYARFSDKDASSSCGIVAGSLLSGFFRSMKGLGLPVLSLLEAKPPVVGVPRVDLVPEISSVYDKGLNCVSWVSLSAQSQATLTIPPIGTPRRVTVTYWRQGVLVSSPESFHAHEVEEALTRLGQQLADQYKADQPPILPGSGGL